MPAKKKKIKKILIANRGEIAVRIIHACREMDIPAAVIYSEADRTSLHVQLADESICIGPPSPLESYLNIDAVIGAAKKCGADAVHPGYGFLAENADFAERCVKEGLIFIGPPAQAIRDMGDKVESRRIMESAGIPVVPGTTGAVGKFKQLLKAASSIEPPLFVKASAGGGGKGMRIVDNMADLESTIEAASREAESAFGNGTVYIEKVIENPRHIEFQVLLDQHGAGIHLFERECSIQRRHQKLVEETPSTALTPDVRRIMGETAVAAARAVGYQNAGTVEFLFDDKKKEFYFLEMNTRIQVEHPVTELTTGVDLVKWQIRIAQGEPLSLTQEGLVQRGHAIECRIYAEDPTAGFMPSSGKILYLQEPSGPGVRNDSGIYDGYEVTTHYDPILSKLVTWDETREGARLKMITALENYVILGIKTCTLFLRDLLAHQAFIDGKTNTDFIPKYMSEWSSKTWRPKDGGPPDEVLVAAALMEYLAKPIATGGDGVQERAPTPWQTVGRWEIGGGA
ncbi:MAG: acetyl-CoA carboxylase biotin carboxylase subunit [Candidatus Latescibacterota bacterium]|nr:MAG: acetyl-CoA carboxylase biotin carboxylase subunit [Candidatus Latescibacterota bacterium]